MVGRSARDTIARIAAWTLTLVVFMLRRFMWLASIQKFSLFLLFLQFLRSPRVQGLHLPHILGRKLWQVTNESDQFPGILLVAACATSPRGHPRQADAVLDNVEQLAVG